MIQNAKTNSSRVFFQTTQVRLLGNIRVDLPTINEIENILYLLELTPACVAALQIWESSV